MSEWINYSDSEVSVFHPLCEKVLNDVLIKLQKDKEYEVIHHHYVGALQADYVILNKKTRNVFCVIEVKRTPADVQSNRYQNQAMSYVQNNLENTERGYYVLTNLESYYSFLYSQKNPKVVQQILEPGFVRVADFDKYDENDFLEKLTQDWTRLFSSFFHNQVSYSNNLNHIDSYIQTFKGEKTWNSGVASIFYEYMRGIFKTIKRPDSIVDIRSWSGNMRSICTEASRIDDTIYSYSDKEFLPKYETNPMVLLHSYECGESYVSPDPIAEIVYNNSSNLAHEGEVPTDLELAKVLSIIAKSYCKKPNIVCDPAAGSGNLITAAMDCYNLSPINIKANDVKEKYAYPLSFRISLHNAMDASSVNEPVISSYNIAELEQDYFSDVDLILMNPPFLKGSDDKAILRKKPLYCRISQLSGKIPITHCGQMNLFGPFLELICEFAKEGTYFACILPTFVLNRSGSEYQAIRNVLLNKFNLKLIFQYPEQDLFSEVSIKTAIFIGCKNDSDDEVKLMCTSESIPNIDQNILEKSLDVKLTEEFTEVVPTIYGMKTTRKKLFTDPSLWNYAIMQDNNSELFIKSIKNNNKIIKISNNLDIKRGMVGNSGCSDITYIKSWKNPELNVKTYSECLRPGLKNAESNCAIIENGEQIFDITKLSYNSAINFIEKYFMNTTPGGKQVKKSKTVEEIYSILLNDCEKGSVPPWSVLMPRAIRKTGKVYLTTDTTFISTNFIIIFCTSAKVAKLLVSWFTSVFFQLLCEMNSTNDAGVRKIEKNKLSMMYMPDLSKIPSDLVNKIIEEPDNFSFIELSNPQIRNVDRIWSQYLFNEQSETILNESSRLLKILSNKRQK